MNELYINDHYVVKLAADVAGETGRNFKEEDNYAVVNRETGLTEATFMTLPASFGAAEEMSICLEFELHKQIRKNYEHRALLEDMASVVPHDNSAH